MTSPVHPGIWGRLDEQLSSASFEQPDGTLPGIWAHLAQLVDPAEFRPKARRDLALMAKRRGEYSRAAEIWEEIVSDPQDGIYACEQLAIHYERKEKDFFRAAEFAELALAKLRRQRSLSAGISRDPYLAARCARLEQKFLHRIARLQRHNASGLSANIRA